MIWHITTAAAWAAAQKEGSYRAASLESEGFIHCSTAGQLIEVANAFYAGKRGLVVLGIEPGRLAAEVRYEDLYQSGQRFPHVYGPIPLAAVTQVHELRPDSQGRFSLPAGLEETGGAG